MSESIIIQKLQRLAPVGIWSGHAGNHPQFTPGTSIYQVYPLNDDGTAIDESAESWPDFADIETAIDYALAHRTQGRVCRNPN